MGLWSEVGPVAEPVQIGHEAQAARWQAPSVVEHELYAAKARGDWAGYLDVLGRTLLFIADSRARLDVRPETVVFTPYWDTRVRSSCLAVFTPGMLPAPVADPVLVSRSLNWYAESWKEGDPPLLAVNPGSPCEAFLATTPAHRAVWRRHADRVFGGGLPQHQLSTLHVGGPLHGRLAHGLACAALMFVKNSEFWNAMAYHGGGYTDEKDRLRDHWGVTNRAEWQRTQERLLQAQMISGVWEFALGLRRSLALDFAGPIGVDHWRQVADRVLRNNAVKNAEARITAEGVTTAQPRDDAVVEAQVAGVQRLIGRITRYEARFRADGLLPEDKFVRTVEAWDYGRASGMARWGLAARYCTLQEAERAVLSAGRSSQANYRSWEEFSAAYILGRCLHFDEEEFGDWYGEMLAAHRVLTTEPSSPWLNIPWK
ncbi:DUF1266 domain-containing protein [Streptomyces sp. H27-D2]|uniref:DUF1266 domain-containing protein n=1 Tax=Streptomyces sp. H27-D2 TaxID=3046304 RepID=UPI002DBE2665|nr:DUF1266 domain-containing protein [Streptomyces sp. H27-D2]MEC4019283.1 DUF1266 domain-containing protein [Streptomyces sp. H27-D2]